jgi:hypothetical protein
MSLALFPADSERLEASRLVVAKRPRIARRMYPLKYCYVRVKTRGGVYFLPVEAAPQLPAGWWHQYPASP